MKRAGFTLIECLTVLAVVLVVIAFFVTAKMQSDTYNKLTGAHTTWWDALWVELRVSDTPKDSKK